MHIYFSGIGGAGLGPLAQLSLDCGFEVSGSDLNQTLSTKEVQKRGVKVYIGQTGKEIKDVNNQKKIDWFVYSSGIKKDHPERKFITEWNQNNPDNKIKETKRDELLNYIIKENNLKLIAISGTHGKTTTTGMMVWVFKQLGLPISYSIGSNISFGPAAKYENDSRYFIYECDEFDKNFLNFHPFGAIITSLDYDHHDTYPTIQDYRESFAEFIIRTKKVTVAWNKDLDILNLKNDNLKTFDNKKEGFEKIKLAGQRNRENAFLVIELIKEILPEIDENKLHEIISTFPGTQRRMEKLSENFYTDYAHHPEEIKASLGLASELSDSVVAVYQPHQNIRQHRLKDEYKDCFLGIKKAYWLPTYLSREDKNLKIMKPKELIQNVKNREVIEIAEMSESLATKIKNHIKNKDLVVLMGAGSIDSWGRGL